MTQNYNASLKLTTILVKLIYTKQKKKRTATIIPLRCPFNSKMLINMKYSFLIT